ncbi:MAG: hypothetical protein Q4E03_02115 [Trueperella sp.]|nr:hypothetical protein [Trueperella sp.]
MHRNIISSGDRPQRRMGRFSVKAIPAVLATFGLAFSGLVASTAPAFATEVDDAAPVVTQPETLAADGLDDQCLTMRQVTDADQPGYVAPAQGKKGYVTNAEVGEPLAFEATTLGRYRIYDTAGNILFLSVFNEVWPGESYGDRADWTVTAVPGEPNTFTIAATLNGTELGTTNLSKKLGREAGAKFVLEPAEGCFQVPEIETGMVSPRTEPTVNADGTINGIIDSHVHTVSAWGFGGKFMCGYPFAPGGVEQALADCDSHAYGQGALFDMIVAGAPYMGPQDGWPTFSTWPNATRYLHQVSYYKSVERTWQSGVNILNVMLVGNRTICQLYARTPGKCNEMDQIVPQYQALLDMQDYIDAQNGGAGKGWFRIARTPEQAREIVADGKLAVLISVEVSELFGCTERNGKAQCDKEAIDAGLDMLQSWGVHSIHPIHKFDNAFGGTRMDAGAMGIVMNLGNLLNTGHWFDVQKCPDGVPADRAQITVSDEYLNFVSKVTGKSKSALFPIYPEGDACNLKGLTDSGEYLLSAMMDRGMIINLGHMSSMTAKDAMELVTAKGYPGVSANHSWTSEQVRGEIVRAGGFLGGYSFSASHSYENEPDFLEQWRGDLAAIGEEVDAYGFGSDAGGLGPLPGARFDAAEKPLVYPITAPSGAVFDKQKWGEREFDLNTDGVAQYGMYADWFADILSYANAEESAKLRSQLMNSAERYVKVWENSIAWGK